MSSIFQDGTDFYTDATWHSGPWRNYIRKPKAVRLTFPIDDVDMDFFCVEEDLIGYRLKIFGASGDPDSFSEIIFYDNDWNQLARTTDTMKFETVAGGLGHIAQMPVFHSDGGYNWVLPGAGFRVAENEHRTALFTDTRTLTYTISADDLSPKTFDGGVHSWLKLDNSDTGTGYALYSKPIPSEFIQRENLLLVFNSLGNAHTYNTTLNRAHTLHLEGSLDGVHYLTLAMIMDDIDIRDVDGLSESYQLTYPIYGNSFPKYNYYRFKWYVEAGLFDEGVPNQQNFLLLSLYKISR